VNIRAEGRQSENCVWEKGENNYLKKKYIGIYNFRNVGGKLRNSWTNAWYSHTILQNDYACSEAWLWNSHSNQTCTRFIIHIHTALHMSHWAQLTILQTFSVITI
jgi:hypothetical protein